MFSDAQEIKDCGVVFEVDCKMIVVKQDEIDTGANASAEEATEELEDGAQTVNNVVYASQLQESAFDKKSYTTYIKGYMKDLAKKLEETNPDRVDAFKKEAGAFVMKVIKNIKDYEFYTGESMDPEGMVALLNYREDGITPYLTFFKDGLEEMKV